LPDFPVQYRPLGAGTKTGPQGLGPRQLGHAQDQAHSRLAAKRPRYQVHFTPTSASWITQVERWFALLTDKQIRRGVHRSVADLEHDIESFIARTNAEPKPFRWLKSADEILASVRRFCLRTPGPDQTTLPLPQTSEAGH